MVRFFFQETTGAMLSLGVILMSIMLGFLALMTLSSGAPSGIYFLIGFIAAVGFALYAFLSSRLLILRYYDFGVNKWDARALIADWGMKRWWTRDPRLTQEIAEHALDRAKADRLEHRLEGFRPLFGQDWLAVALVIAQEAAEKKQLTGPGALVSVPDAVERAAQDTRDIPLLAQLLITLGVDAGCDAYRNDIPYDYAQVLYTHAAQSDHRIDLSRYRMDWAPVGWRWSHP